MRVSEIVILKSPCCLRAHCCHEVSFVVFLSCGFIVYPKLLSMTPASVSCGHCCVQPACPLTKPLPSSFWEFSRVGKPTVWVSASISTMRLKQSASNNLPTSYLVLTHCPLTQNTRPHRFCFQQDLSQGFCSWPLTESASVYAACISSAWRLANAIPAMIIRRERVIFIKWGSVHHYSRA